MDDGQFVLISSSSCHEVHLTALIGGKFLLENLDHSDGRATRMLRAMELEMVRCGGP